MRRIHSFLHILISHRVLASFRKVAKLSQMGLVTHLYKEDDPLRFCRNLRVDASTFDFLVELIQNDAIFSNNSNNPQLPIQYQLAIALYRFGHYGNASSAEAVAQWAGCSAGLVVKATRRVMTAFLPLNERAVHWPSEDEKSAASDWVEAASCAAWRPGFALVDGTLIPLHAKPGHYGEQFCDRKSNYSLNVQVRLSACLLNSQRCSLMFCSLSPYPISALSTMPSVHWVARMTPRHSRRPVHIKNMIHYFGKANGYGATPHIPNVPGSSHHTNARFLKYGRISSSTIMFQKYVR